MLHARTMDNDPKCSNCCFFHFSDPEDSKTVYHSPKHLLIEGLTSVICSTEIQSMYPCWNENAIVHNHQWTPIMASFSQAQNRCNNWENCRTTAAVLKWKRHWKCGKNSSFFSRQQAQENSTTQQQYRGVLFPIFQTMWLNSKQLML